MTGASTTKRPADAVARMLLRLLVRRAALRALSSRALDLGDGQSVRWLTTETNTFLRALEEETGRLRDYARLEGLTSFGNRILVELAVYTAASDRVLRKSGVTPKNARCLVSDIGWDVYKRLLMLSSLPFRLSSRDPGKRLQRTVRALLRFPFKAKGEPGYAVRSWTEAGNVHTHFTHCPPWTFVREMSAAEDDPDAEETFRQSWCMYDWPGADLIAGDGLRGHYRRSKTLSNGDPVCDMCWAAAAGGMPDQTETKR